MEIETALELLNIKGNLKRGDTNKKAIAAFQTAIEHINLNLYTGRIDGDFGPMTETAAMRFQQLRLLNEDGIVGPITKNILVAAIQSQWTPGKLFPHPSFPVSVFGCRHPKLGDIPDAALGAIEAGKVSYFGGPDDKHDRIYGQAYIRGAESPAKLLRRHRELIAMGILRDMDSKFGDGDLSHLEEWPMTTDWKGREKRASTSWMLNPKSYYIAMRWRTPGRSLGYMDDKNPRLFVWSEETKKVVVCLRTDYGPHPRAGRLMDLSPGALEYLGLKTDDTARVCWASDNATIGPVE